MTAVRTVHLPEPVHVSAGCVDFDFPAGDHQLPDEFPEDPKEHAEALARASALERAAVVLHEASEAFDEWRHARSAARSVGEEAPPAPSNPFITEGPPPPAAAPPPPPPPPPAADQGQPGPGEGQ